MHVDKGNINLLICFTFPEEDLWYLKVLPELSVIYSCFIKLKLNQNDL